MGTVENNLAQNCQLWISAVKNTKKRQKNILHLKKEALYAAHIMLFYIETFSWVL